MILGGRGSHATIGFMWEYKKNCLDILYLPAHSSHVVQSLDL
jgi:hypothetical protein